MELGSNSSGSNGSSNLFVYTFVASLVIMITIFGLAIGRYARMRRRQLRLLGGMQCSIATPRPILWDLHLYGTCPMVNCANIQPLSLGSNVEQTTIDPYGKATFPYSMISDALRRSFQRQKPRLLRSRGCNLKPTVEMGVLIAMPTLFPLGKYPLDDDGNGLAGVVVEMGICEEQLGAKRRDEKV
ncbi:hypothetical protein DL96DRAFT_567040 [Flagelloscypha sp. PMI_526]|nr:hypothetical protein DL96DRAFT_567040 [Flagelloscypha sp. PMI_526]